MVTNPLARIARCGAWLAPLALWLIATPCAATSVVRASFTTPARTVAPGAEFEVTIEVGESGLGFNAFELLVSFDPAALTLVPMTPISQQVGPLLRDACPNVFHQSNPSQDTETAACAMLCGGVSVSGPGPIYRLRFRASTTPQVTVLRLKGFTAYLGGLRLDSAPGPNAAIGIGLPVTLDAGDGSPSALMLAAGPNPARGVVWADATMPRATSARLEVLDASGRRIRLLVHGRLAAGAQRYTWDGRRDDGGQVAAGVYFVRLVADGTSLARRVELIW